MKKLKVRVGSNLQSEWEKSDLFMFSDSWPRKAWVWESFLTLHQSPHHLVRSAGRLFLHFEPWENSVQPKKASDWSKNRG